MNDTLMPAAQSALVLPIFPSFLAASTGLRSVFRQTVVDAVPEFCVAGQVASLFLSLRQNSWQTVL